MNLYHSVRSASDIVTTDFDFDSIRLRIHICSDTGIFDKLRFQGSWVTILQRNVNISHRFGGHTVCLYEYNVVEAKGGGGVGWRG